MNELAKRIITAIILIPLVILLTVWDNTIPFAVGIYLITLLGNREVISLMRSAGEPVVSAIGWLGALIIPLCFYFTEVRWILFTFVLVALIFAVFIVKLFASDPVGDSVRYAAVNLFAALFFPLLFSFMWLLRELPGGALWIFYLFVAIWASDSLAYFVGSKFGKHKIVPKVSPKKSLEGFVAGIIGGVGLSILFYYLFIAQSTPLSAIKIIIMSADVVAAGILGDLFESMLKRGAHVKDSGKLIPGHGGVLDRLDSMLFAAPILYIYLRLWGVA